MSPTRSGAIEGTRGRLRASPGPLRCFPRQSAPAPRNKIVGAPLVVNRRSAACATCLRLVGRRVLRHVARVLRLIARVLRLIARVLRLIARVLRLITRVLRLVARVRPLVARALLVAPVLLVASVVLHVAYVAPVLLVEPVLLVASVVLHVECDVLSVARVVLVACGMCWLFGVRAMLRLHAASVKTAEILEHLRRATSGAPTVSFRGAGADQGGKQRRGPGLARRRPHVPPIARLRVGDIGLSFGTDGAASTCPGRARVAGTRNRSAPAPRPMSPRPALRTRATLHARTDATLHAHPTLQAQAQLHAPTRDPTAERERVTMHDLQKSDPKAAMRISDLIVVALG